MSPPVNDETPLPAAAAAGTESQSVVASGDRSIEAEREPRPLGLWTLCGLALVMGIVTGFGAVLFRALIGIVHNLLFPRPCVLGLRRQHLHAAAALGRLGHPRAGRGLVRRHLHRRHLRAGSPGHGVPEVMDAIYYKRGVIRPVVAVAKSLASAMAIGSGAAVGREGPIIQIGSALGSTLGQIVRMPAASASPWSPPAPGPASRPPSTRRSAACMFATELMLPEISVNTFLPVALATGAATFIGRLFFGAAAGLHRAGNLAPLPERR